MHTLHHADPTLKQPPLGRLRRAEPKLFLETLKWCGPDSESESRIVSRTPPQCDSRLATNFISVGYERTVCRT